MSKESEEIEQRIRRVADYYLPGNPEDRGWDSEELNAVRLFLNGLELQTIIRLIRKGGEV